jgi:hypothetical protein
MRPNLYRENPKDENGNCQRENSETVVKAINIDFNKIRGKTISV